MSEARRDSSVTVQGVGHDAGQAAKEVFAGDPGPSARRWLGPAALFALVMFLINSLLVLSGVTRASFDLPLEQFVQHVPWGPLTYWMSITNITGGAIQDAFGVVVVLALLGWEKRAGYLMALGAIASLIDQFIKVSVQRGRPTADLVQVLNPSNGYSYPSGHAVFFTWLYFMLAIAIAPRIQGRYRWILWTTSGALIFLACVGRVWAGAHWPTDVIGGFFLAMAWCCFVLWVPERWLPSPSWHWIRRGQHGAQKVTR